MRWRNNHYSPREAKILGSDKLWSRCRGSIWNFWRVLIWFRMNRLPGFPKPTSAVVWNLVRKQIVEQPTCLLWRTLSREQMTVSKNFWTSKSLLIDAIFWAIFFLNRGDVLQQRPLTLCWPDRRRVVRDWWNLETVPQTNLHPAGFSPFLDPAAATVAAAGKKIQS